MHTIPILNELVVVLAVAGLIVWIFQRLRLPPILGFLAAGVVVGPAGLGVVQDQYAIEVMAEIGIVLLLFTIGLELSLEQLARMARLVFGGGVGQGLITTAVGVGAAMAVGFELRPAFFLGILLAASSTALVLRLLGDAGKLGTPFGRLALAILLFQDIVIVLLMLVVPVLGGQDATLLEVGTQIGLALAVITAMYVGARFVFPWVLERVVASRSRELFTMVTVVTVFGTAYLAGLAGLSLALGAFIAGLVVSESHFAHQMMDEVLPFRDLFNGLFFVSVGLLVDPAVLLAEPLLVVGLIVGVMIAKAVIVTAVGPLVGLDLRNAIIAGAALSQVGEFSFILAQQGRQYNLISPENHALFVAVVVGTMALTPVALWLGETVAARLPVQTPTHAALADEQARAAMDDHVIIVGYGLNGRNVARVLRQIEVPYVVVEMNVGTVEDQRALGEPIYFGDASRPVVLEHLGVEEARALVVAVGDPATTREVVAAARRANPKLWIAARTRYVAEIRPLEELGADLVVPEEFETSLELAGRVMAAYGASPRAIDREKRLLRAAQYRVLLDDEAPALPTLEALVGGLSTEYVDVEPDHRYAARDVGAIEADLPPQISVLAVLRGDASFVDPPDDCVVEAGDVLVLLGPGHGLRKAAGG